MRVFVELAQDVDARTWPVRHAAGQAADASPYGLALLTEHGHTVRFRHPLRGTVARRSGESLAARMYSMQGLHALAALAEPARRSADVVLCMDERNGLPAIFAPSPVPVVTGVAWLEDPARLPAPYVAIAREGLRRAAGVFVECSAMRDPLVERFGVDPARLHVIRLGIDEQHFRPSAERPEAGRVFSVGDDRMRDYGTLVAALETVRGRLPHMSAEIATTLSVDLPAWAVVHRRRMDAAVRDCYRRAQVVALALEPTRQGSGLTVILEAMASGRPVVVTDNPGLSDYVEHGVTGLLVPPGSPGAMAEAVARLVRDPETAARMGAAGRARVMRKFTTRHMIDDLDRVLRASVSPVR